MTALQIINRHAPRKADTDDELLSDLGLDCIDLMTIAMEIEEEYGVVVRDAEIERWTYVSCIDDVIKRKDQTPSTHRSQMDAHIYMDMGSRHHDCSK